MFFLILARCLLTGTPSQAADRSFSIATLNGYWLLGEEENWIADKPRSEAEYELKA